MLKDKNIIYIASVSLVFSLLILGSVVNMYIMKNLYHSFMDLADTCYLQYENGDTISAMESAVKLTDTWDGAHLYLSAILNHEDIDNVTISLSRAVSALENNEKNEFRTEFSILQKLLFSIKGMEELSLENIL